MSLVRWFLFTFFCASAFAQSAPSRLLAHLEAGQPEHLVIFGTFLGRLDRLPAPVKSSPGFLVNRALTPYMLEAMVMLDEKIDKELADAMKRALAMDKAKSKAVLAAAGASGSTGVYELDHARGSLAGRNRDLLNTVGAVVKEELLRVKDALDPAGILAPGKQGIWPRRFRCPIRCRC